jgi:hypothetical protein
MTTRPSPTVVLRHQRRAGGRLGRSAQRPDGPGRLGVGADGSDQFIVAGDPLVSIDGISGGLTGWVGRHDPGRQHHHRHRGHPQRHPQHAVRMGADHRRRPTTLNGVATELNTAPAELSRTGHGAAVLPDGDT